MRIPTPVVLLIALVAVTFVVATVFRVLSTPLYLLLGLGVATAAISYWSDQLGMKLGKKRITLLGLRPRQTATLISILSSLAIMIVTLAVMLLVYSPLKNALFRYDSERERNQQLTSNSLALQRSIVKQQKSIDERTRKNQFLSHELNKKNTDLESLGVRVGKSQADLSKASVNLRNAQSARSSAEAERSRAESARNQAQSARNQAQSARNQAQSARTVALNAKIAAESARQIALGGQARARRGEVVAQRRTTLAQQRFAQAQSQLSVATTQLQNAQAKVQSAQAKVQRAEEKVQNAEKEVLDTEKNLASTQSKLRATNAELKSAERGAAQAVGALKNVITAKVKVDKDLEQKQAELAAIQTQLAQTNTQLTEARTGLTEAERELDIYNSTIQNPGLITASLGQIFGSAVLPANTNETDARATLTALLSQGRKTVRQEGFESLSLAPIRIGGQELEEDQIITALTRNILSKAASPYSVRLVAARDHARGETEVVARLLAVEVKTAFEKGEVLAETTIEVTQNSAAGDAQLFNQLFRLVDRAGRAKADERRVVPLLTVETPNFFAPDTNLRIFEAIREIQKLGTGRRVRVKLVAADTLSTIESPRVRFEVG